MATQEQINEMWKHRQQYALEAMLEAMENAAKTLEESAREIRRYAQRAKEMHENPEGGHGCRPTDVAGWAISHAVQYAPTNMRIDLIAKHAAEYAVATEALKAEGV